MSASVTEIQAKEILKSHFISQEEAKMIYPDLPNNLSINFSESFLKKNSTAWLIPVKVSTKEFKYFLIRSVFEHEICLFKKIDTLDLKTAKEALSLFDKLRPDFPKKSKVKSPFKYFFRTKTSDINNYHKVIACNEGCFIVIDLPNETELGVINKDSIFYVTENNQIGYKKLPPEIVKKNQTIFILNLINHKNE